jgi:TRAP-type uncharacterized transport system substrate-binding protein
VEQKVVFAGAAPERAGTPWGTLALVVRKALQPMGYRVDIEILSWGANNPRYVSDGRADLGATQYRAVEEAFEGTEAWSREGPRSNLRLIATINQPAWIAVGIRAASGITDLAQVAEDRMPIRLKAGGEKAIRTILDYYGLSHEKVVEWGGHIIGLEAPQEPPSDDPFARWLARDWNQIAPWVAKGEFDVIVDPIYAANTPEHKHWLEASILHDLRFMPLPSDLIRRIMVRKQAEAPGFIPHRLLRGVNEDIPTVQRFPQVIYTRSEAPEDLIFQVTEALDKGRHLFRETHMPYSYDPANVAGPRVVPLHPAAERYYRAVGHLP